MTKKPEPRPNWRASLESAIEQAAENPEEFLADAKLFGKKITAVVSEVNRRMKDDPNFPARVAKNKAVSAAAKWARKKLGEIE